MQALVAAIIAAVVSLVGFGLVAYVVHKLRHSRAPFWWGVIVAAVLVAVYTYFNYLGR